MISGASSYWAIHSKSWVIVAGTILFVIALKRYLSRLIARFIFRFIQRIGSGLDRSTFLDLVVGPIGTFLVVFVSITSIEKLHFPRELDFDLLRGKIESHHPGAGRHHPDHLLFLAAAGAIVDFIAVILRTKARKDGSHRDNQMIVFLSGTF